MNKNEQGKGVGGTSMCVRSLFKKTLRFSKWSFKVILHFFLLIAQKRTRTNKGGGGGGGGRGGGVKTRESWANVLFECPLKTQQIFSFGANEKNSFYGFYFNSLHRHPSWNSVKWKFFKSRAWNHERAWQLNWKCFLRTWDN